MALAEQFTCDVCGAERKQTNHWFTAITRPCGLQAERTVSLLLYPWPTGHRNMEGGITAHLCGEACTIAYVQQYLTKQQADSVKAKIA